MLSRGAVQAEAAVVHDDLVVVGPGRGAAVEHEGGRPGLAMRSPPVNGEDARRGVHRAGLDRAVAAEGDVADRPAAAQAAPAAMPTLLVIEPSTSRSPPETIVRRCSCWRR